jgi:integrase
LNHFNRSLPAVQAWRFNTIVKAKLNATVKFTMTNGGTFRRDWAGEAIVIRRSDVERVHDYARENAELRDYLFVRLPMKVGLRTGELATLKIENINFDSRSFTVLDSKNRMLYPLPLDVLTLELVKELIRDRVEGYVFTRRGSWIRARVDKPLTVDEIWYVVRKIGEEAGVPNFNPRILRHYFAVVWAHVEKKSLVVLQRILRHKSLATTQVYVDKLVFWEDMQSEYEGAKRSPIEVSHSICDGCGLKPICKFAPLPECATDCRYKLKKEAILKNG